MSRNASLSGVAPLPRISTLQPATDIARAAAAELVRGGDLYVRDGTLVEVRVDDAGRACVNSITSGALECLLASHMEFAHARDAALNVGCPRAALKLLLNQPDSFAIPRLDGVAYGALLTAQDGLVVTPGYHAASAYYVAAVPGLSLSPGAVGEAEAASAKRVLDDVLGEFGFATDAHRAAAIAVAATLCARSLIQGSVPMFLITGSASGTGKSTLADVLGAIVTGVVPEHAAPPTSTRELTVLTNAMIREQRALAVIDNANGILSSSALASAATSETQLTIAGRVTTTATVRSVFVFTGVDLRPSPELARRCAVIRLESLCEHVGEREHVVGEIVANVIARRAELLSALFTILRNHLADGVDAISLSPWNSYGSWSSVVRGALVRVGYRDPIETMRVVRDAVDMRPLVAASLLPWLRTHAGDRRLTAKDIVDMLTSSSDDAATEHLTSLLLDVCDSDPATRKCGLTATSIGVILSTLRSAQHGGYRLVGTSANGRRAWRVERFESGDGREFSNTDTGGGPPPGRNEGAIANITTGSPEIQEAYAKRKRGRPRKVAPPEPVVACSATVASEPVPDAEQVAAVAAQPAPVAEPALESRAPDNDVERDGVVAAVYGPEYVHNSDLMPDWDFFRERPAVVAVEGT